MKSSIIAKSLTIAAVAIVVGMAAPAKAGDKGCSNASLTGTFAYTSTGFITAPAALAGPFAEVGTQTFDGSGKTTAAATLSQNGNIVPVTATGTYTVNPDCTGTLTLQVSPIASTVNVFFVIGDSGSEIQAIETSTAPGPSLGLVITRIYRRQFPAGDWRQ